MERLGEGITYGSVAVTGLGPGISFMDFDNDGWDDITLPASANRDFQFLRNTGGQFEILDLPISSGGIQSRQAIWVDFDNDGDNDFFAVSDVGRCWFYRNEGNYNFTDIIGVSGLPTAVMEYWGASWGDYNNDGFLDVFISVRDPMQVNHNLLYRNDGDGTFTNVTVAAKLSLDGHITFCSSFIDYDRDGFQDIYMANDKEVTSNILYRNKGDGTFEDVSISSGTDLHMNAMSTTIHDYNNDGWLDIYVTNIYPPLLPGTDIGNAFLLNNRNGTFTNIALENGTRFDSFGWGAVFLDSENDGDLDLYVSSHLDGNDGRKSSAYYQNNGSGIYTIPSSVGFIDDTANSYGNAIGDIQNDGLPDIAVVNTMDQPMMLWENKTVSDQNWLKIKLQGTESNRMGIGSFIEVGAGGQTYFGYTLCGEGYISQNSSSKIFGIGTNEMVDYVEVTWLSGITDRIENIGSNQFITIVEGSNPIENEEDDTENGASENVRDTINSVARQWNEALLDAIRTDLARPTVHARNLFHSALAMYDAWAVFDENSETVFLGKTFRDFSCEFKGMPSTQDLEAARREVLSYAMYSLLHYRFSDSPGAAAALPRFSALMSSLGYNTNNTSTDYETGSYAALGNYLAAKLIEFGNQDGSNEENTYTNTYYTPINDPLMLGTYEDSYGLIDPNRWQPLTFETFIDQSGNPISGETPEFLSPEWGEVIPFALKQAELEILDNGFKSYIYSDPGAPPSIQVSNEDGIEDPYKWHFALVASWSSHLDPDDPTLIDISPGAIGNVDIAIYPESFQDYQAFYDFEEGGDIGLGHPVNPRTGQPYTPQMVKRADYARVLAEFWADGPDSETPPGHWFTILNYVSDHPDTQKRFAGEGDVMDNLEWDVKSYLALGGAMHDAAIATWGVKGYYDYIRPISAIRYMASKGQSSNAELPAYDPHGLPLIPGRIELVESGDPLAGPGGENVGEVKIYAWRGPDFIGDPTMDVAGVGWILGTRWWPYQRPTFVTPPFAGYVSGHSTFSRAAAEVLTLLTGDPFFPGGMGVFNIEENRFLVFEQGPSQGFSLQWATYRDASDQTSLSRIWGGIHPPIDDIPGRIIGEKVGKDAFDLAQDYFEGLVSIPTDNFLIEIKGESCIDSNDGFIHITAKDYYNYRLSLNQQEYSFNREIEIANLAPGTYQACITVVDNVEFEHCYDLVVQEVTPIDVNTSIVEEGIGYKAKFEINKGTPPFTIEKNDRVIGAFENTSFETEVINGDLLVIRSGKACEGLYSQKVSFQEKIIYYPNPTSNYLTVLGSSHNRVSELYNSEGRHLGSFSGKDPIDFSTLGKGVYFLVITYDRTTEAIKVVVAD
ncbi:FG-GAP-like repeat-containing protein [Ulvibacterium sp.]|uniref:FG-GAP-like repeat-containing protein n=1 Tax=Ulvibacterium sp. TaxID=2665914 RepID=UPI003CC57B59